MPVAILLQYLRKTACHAHWLQR